MMMPFFCNICGRMYTDYAMGCPCLGLDDVVSKYTHEIVSLRGSIKTLHEANLGDLVAALEDWKESEVHLMARMLGYFAEQVSLEKHLTR